MTGLRLMTALAVMLGVLSWGCHSISSHGPAVALAAEGSHQAVQDLGEDHDHDGHVHDDGADEEPASDHVHSHNPVDHSHVAMSLAAGPLVLPFPIRAAWQGGPPWTRYGEPLYFLDRPPRSGFGV